MNYNAISSYHCHTYLCKHANGTVDEYVKHAEKEGCSALGFSDHCPYPDSDWENWPDIRMGLSDVEGYCRAVRACSEKVSFPIYLGFECEWDKKYESWYRDELLGKYGAQYLVLGSHWVTIGHHHLYAPEIDTPSDLHTYTDQTIEAIESGLYSFIAHPDLFMLGWREWDLDASACLGSILSAAVSCGLPLEINGLGLKRPRFKTKNGIRHGYPYDEFWQTVSDSGAAVICNSDSHCPEDVLSNARLARDYAALFSINPVDLLF